MDIDKKLQPSKVSNQFGLRVVKLVLLLIDSNILASLKSFDKGWLIQINTIPYLE